MTRTISAAAFLVVCFVSVPPAAAQDSGCFRAPQLSGSAAQFLAATMTVARDRRCTHTSSLVDARVDTPPRNGRLEGGGSGFTYIPNPGFVGSDSYVYSGEAPGRRGSRTAASGRVAITVSVTVQ